MKVENGVCDLLKLFVEPSEIGNNYGTDLFEWAILEARHLGSTLMTFESDPGAEPFHRSGGAHVVGAAPSASISGRDLPLLELSLTEDRSIRQEIV